MVRNQVLFLETQETFKVEIWIFKDDSACQVENRPGKSGNSAVVWTGGNGDLGKGSRGR